MGKASSRKRNAGGGSQLRASASVPGPANNPDIARAMLRADAVFAEARALCEAFAESMPPAKVKRFFHALGLSLGDVQRALHPGVMQAQECLGLPVSLAGVSGVAIDGRKVSVGLDGVVQDTAPDEVLVSLGLKPAAAAKGKAVAALPPADASGAAPGGPQGRFLAPAHADPLPKRSRNSYPVTKGGDRPE